MEKVWAYIKKLFLAVVKEIKGFLDDTFFGAIECQFCKHSDKRYTFHKTKDGMPICKNCYEKLSGKEQDFLSETEYASVEQTLRYQEYSDTKLKPIYREDLSYEFMGVDTKNGLVKIGSVIMEMRNLDHHVLSFNPSETAGVLQNKVRGNVKAIFSTNDPVTSVYETVAVDVTAPARMTLSGECVFQNPKKLDAFIEELDRLIAQFKAAEQ